MNLAFRPMEEADARLLVTWQYPPPFDRYNVDVQASEEHVMFFADQANQYYAITNEQGLLVAFCCFGQDARVPGGDYGLDALDIGFGLRPDLVGQGYGRVVVGAVLDFARKTFAPAVFRATVAGFNERSQRVCQRLGFQRVQTFGRSGTGEPFVVFVRGAEHGTC
jgi:[ribosomal protein S18]-alanine N-acetyltransferase